MNVQLNANDSPTFLQSCTSWEKLLEVEMQLLLVLLQYWHLFNEYKYNTETQWQ